MSVVKKLREKNAKLEETLRDLSESYPCACSPKHEGGCSGYRATKLLAEIDVEKFEVTDKKLCEHGLCPHPQAVRLTVKAFDGGRILSQVRLCAEHAKIATVPPLFCLTKDPL